MLCDITELQRLSRQCHCTNEINALRTTLEKKIGNIQIGKYRDEVSALNAQIEIIANDVKTAIAKLCQDLDCQLNMINHQVTESTTNVALYEALKTRLDNLKNQVKAQAGHIDTINTRSHDNSRELLDIRKTITETVTHAEIKLCAHAKKLNDDLTEDIDKKLAALEEKLTNQITTGAIRLVQPGRKPGGQRQFKPIGTSAGRGG